MLPMELLTKRITAHRAHPPRATSMPSAAVCAVPAAFGRSYPTTGRSIVDIIDHLLRRVDPFLDPSIYRLPERAFARLGRRGIVGRAKVVHNYSERSQKI